MPTELQAIDAQASVLMKTGIRLMNDPQSGSVGEALACFDRALDLRRQLPVDAFPLATYGLAACWLNRGEVLMRLNTPADTAAALASFDAALALLRTLPLEDDFRFPKRLAIALQHRGLALHSHGRGSTPASVAAFVEAIAVTDRVTDDETMAEVGLIVRHVFCRTLAQDLDRQTAITDVVHEATDAVDGGLALVRRWERRGVTRFRGIAADLFQFGVRVYARFQPQFLGEFIADHADAERWSRS